MVPRVSPQTMQASIEYMKPSLYPLGASVPACQSNLYPVQQNRRCGNSIMGCCDVVSWA